jgi:hypothetical protein
MVLVAVVSLVAAGCAAPGTGPGRPEPSAAEVAATLNADGSVPWADLKISDEDLNGKPPGPRSPQAGSKPCRAAQLTGSLGDWVRPGNGGETPRGWDAALGKLIGEVDVVNASKVECTLQGEVPTKMYAGGVEVPMLYASGISEEARQRVVAVPAGEHATLRLDWSGPFCQGVSGPLELAIDVPHGGGSLRVAVAGKELPGCAQGEGVDPRAKATLASSAFTEPVAVSAPARSPLDQLTVAIAHPGEAAAGSTVAFRVTLGNPGPASLALDPCPAYLLELFSLGDVTNAAVNSSQLYRMNCRPITGIPAGGSAVFEMRAVVPGSMRAGRQLTVTWKLYLPHYAQRGNQVGAFTLNIT